jgi:predicted nucleic acid-binding protein
MTAFSIGSPRFIRSHGVRGHGGNPRSPGREEAIAGDYRWLVSEEIVSESKEVLTRLGVRRNLVGEVINLLTEAAEFVDVRETSDASPDPDDNPFCACTEQARAAFIATLNPKDFPQRKLRAKVISSGDPIPTTRRRDRSGNR